MIPERSHKFEEFLALSLNRGRPEVHLSLHAPTQSKIQKAGSPGDNERRELNVKAIPFISDGNWHTIQLIRSVKIILG